MSYIGNQPPDIGAYEVQSFDGGGTEFTLQRAATVSSVLLFIDGVRQTPTDAYSVSGVTLTTTATTPSGTDNVTVMFMGDVVDIGTPSNDTVTSAKIVDGSVANADMADMAANTIKVRDANSSGVPSDKALATTEILIGDGTGFTAAALSGDVTMTNAGAVTIATDAVDIAMLSATGTASATTFLRGDNAWAAAGVGDGDVTVAKLSTSATEADNVKKRVAKAWVNFNGTSGSISEDLNFSSVTDNGTGYYTPNFTANMSSGNYAAVGSVCHSSKGVVSISTLAAGSFNVYTREAATEILTNYGESAVIVFGDLA